MVDLQGGRNVPVGARNIEDVLQDDVGKEFELIDVKGAKGKRARKIWGRKGRDFTNFSTPSLADRVEVVLHVLDKKVKASFDDVLQEIFIQFPNALTPIPRTSPRCCRNTRSKRSTAIGCSNRG